MSLIDIQTAIKHLRGKCVAKYPSTFLMGLFAAADELAQLPTIDAVEVVRCKDCKYWNYKEHGYGDCKHGRFVIEGHCDPTMKAEDFCCLGERGATHEID